MKMRKINQEIPVYQDSNNIEYKCCRRQFNNKPGCRITNSIPEVASQFPGGLDVSNDASYTL